MSSTNEERNSLKGISDFSNRSTPEAVKSTPATASARKNKDQRIGQTVETCNSPTAPSSLGYDSPSLRKAAQRAREEEDDDDADFTILSDDSDVCENLVSIHDLRKIKESPSQEFKKYTVNVQNGLRDEVDDHFLTMAKESAIGIMTLYHDIKDELVHSGGQAFIVEDHNGNHWIVTNKHVVCQSEDDSAFLTSKLKGVWHYGPGILKGSGTLFAEYKLIPYSIATKHPLHAPNVKELRWGVDIAAQRISSATGTTFPSIRSFKLCPTDYNYTVGTKIAISIIKSPDSKEVKESKHLRFRNVDLNEFFGKPSSVTILMGEITKVGEKHFMHNINTHSGCSGAAIFLLDTEDRSEQLTVIGVHAGYSPKSEENFGFKNKLEEHPQPECRDTLSDFLEKNIDADEASKSIEHVLDWLKDQGVPSLWDLLQKLDKSDKDFKHNFFKHVGITCIC
eukprot:CAMPEP_0170871424 /NCGR_PEP_ID=MMETSP0734-20130129/25828_1 /TAXON_ID=186038 /ORGANISM="Fragilariopsis kerguelensis, Strain L26-C5" /LENGTH=450 /DNA_ID=CAMNT_0011250747 /DNA_START=14 /DNA_END=1363 /DNA_ORIENTATION=-